MQTYRHEIEQLERHLVSLTQPYTLTANGVYYVELYCEIYLN